MLSKIDFGLAIYGHCAKTHLALLQAPYHTAARRCIRAFPTSPIKTVLTEAGLPDIHHRTTHNTMMLTSKILQCKNKLLFDVLKAPQHATNKPSAIMKCMAFINQLDIISTPQLLKENSHPQWLTLKSSIVDSLYKHQKSKTNTKQYVQLFNDAIEPYKPEWGIIYTDGSKSDTHTTFAVTNDQGVTITVGALPQYCSVLTAEAVALHEAVLFASQAGEKYIICSDSKSTIDALLNTNNNTELINRIKEILHQHRNTIKIMWIPGHASIKGNEFADARAKEAGREPKILYPHFTKSDIRNLVKKTINSSIAREWTNYHHHYKDQNPTGMKPNYSPVCSSQDLKKFVRLRIGHTLRTHSHLLKNSDKPSCAHCNSANLSVIHILDECPALHLNRETTFGNMKPTNLLKTPNIANISAINKFLKLCNILDI